MPLVQFVWHLVFLKSRPFPLLFSKIKDRCAIREKLAREIDAIKNFRLTGKGTGRIN